jgi:hypothetical protein
MTKKTILVISVLISLSLAGCLDNSTSETSTTPQNDVILIDVLNDCTNLEIYTQTTQLANGSIMDTILGVNATLYHAIYSVDAQNLTFEYDLDLDGSGDVYNNVSRGSTTLFIPISYFSNLTNDKFVTSIAASAYSANGQASVLIHIASDCSLLSGVDLGQLTYLSGDFSMYDFTVNDANAALSTGTGEAIVYVSLDAGDDLSWSTVIVQMKAEGGVYVECTNPDKASAAGCAVTDNDDGKWAFGEEVTISEGSDDLCDGTGTCDIQVKILDRSTNKLIYESNVMSV